MKNLLSTILKICSFLLIALLSGCATVFYGAKSKTTVNTNVPTAIVTVTSGKIHQQARSNETFKLQKKKNSEKRRITADDLDHFDPSSLKKSKRKKLEKSKQNLANGQEGEKVRLLTYEVAALGYNSKTRTEILSSRTGVVLLNILSGFLSVPFITLDLATGSHLKNQKVVSIQLEKDPSYVAPSDEPIEILKELLASGSLDPETAAKVKALLEDPNSDLGVNVFGALSQLNNTRETEKQRLDSIYDFTMNQGAETNSTSANSIFLTNYREDSKVAKLRKINNEFPTIKYRRSSIYGLMINDMSRLYNNTIANAFGNKEMLEKYNDHNVGPYLIEVMPGSEPVESIDLFLTEQNVAKKMVAKWFNRSAQGGFSVARIAEAGQYNATEIDVVTAKKTKRGTALLSDAGEELIKNTFLIVNDYKYISKQEALSKAGSVAGYASIGMSFIPGAGVATAAVSTVSAVSSIGSAISNGYVVKTTSYLYQLNWNEEIANTFYTDFWTTDTDIDRAKVDAFIESDLFSLNLIGSQSALADLKSTSFSSKSDQEIIADATIKATDAAYAKLQANYEEFKTKTPLYSVDPLIAKIGLKDGVTENSKFEVLEQNIDENGVTSYKRITIIKVDKDQIWDNRYNAAEDPENESVELTGTYFKGSGKGLYPGMLIKQIK